MWGQWNAWLPHSYLSGSEQPNRRTIIPKSAFNFPYCQLLKWRPPYIQCLLAIYSKRARNTKPLHGQDMQLVPFLSTSKQFFQNTIRKIPQTRLLTQKFPAVRTPCPFRYRWRGASRVHRFLECMCSQVPIILLALLLIENMLWPEMETVIALDK